MELAGKKILVVDDEEGYREILTEEFQHYGAEVISSASGSEAFEIFKNQKFDAILSDIRMPNGDGLFLLNQILNSKLKLPVFVFMSGFAEIDETSVKGKGVAEIFKKPFEILDVVRFLAVKMNERESNEK